MNLQEHKLLINNSLIIQNFNERKQVEKKRNYLSTASIYLNEKKSRNFEFIKQQENQRNKIQSSKFITSLTYSPMSLHQVLSKYFNFF